MCLSVVKIANVKLLETRKWGERKVFIATNQINLEVSMVKKKKKIIIIIRQLKTTNLNYNYY